MCSLRGRFDLSARGKNCRRRPKCLDEAGKWKCTRGIRCAQAEISFEEKFFAAAHVETPMSAAASVLVLREQPAKRRRFRNASHCCDVRGVPHVRTVFAAGFKNILECAAHDDFHARINFFFAPEVALQIL